METIEPMAKRTPPQAMDPEGLDDRERRLRRWAHWDEVELRLRHGWSPHRVVSWYRQLWPGERPPSVMTLYRFLAGKPKSWFVTPLTLHELATGRLPRVLALERHAQLTELQLDRVMTFLRLEREGFGLPIPEVRANIELADRMLERQLRMQQELGLEPRVGAAEALRAEGPGGEVREELRQLLVRLTDLPPEEFAPTLLAVLGPPPVRQPVVLEAGPAEAEPAAGPEPDQPEPPAAEAGGLPAAVV